MPTIRRVHSTARPAVTIQNYLDASRRPLQILLFLLPLVIAYEIGLAILLRSGTGVVTTNRAHEAILRFFHDFGAAQSVLHLGGVAVVLVLLLWHILNRDAWRMDWGVAGIMAIETLLLTLPLLAISQIIARVLAASVVMVGTAAPVNPLLGMPLLSQLAISIGAGLYEELLFRMWLIAVLHTLLVDVGKASQRLGTTIAVIVSAAAFTAYHPLHEASGGISWQKVMFFFVAGLYFGALYVLRGFGIVVGVHALYDVFTVVLLRPPAE